MKRPSFLILLILGLATVAAAEPLVVYSGRSESLVGPLLARFEERTGIELKIAYQGTPALATQLLVEGDQTPADLFLAQDSGYLAVLAERGALGRLPDALLRQADARFRGANGRWVGTSGRARVLVYSPDRVRAEELPRSLQDLADPKWRSRIGWAPGNASFQAHVSALRHQWGDDETRRWLRAVQANRPVVYPKNSPQVKAVASGEIDIGWVNHYYLHKLSKQVGPKARNYSFAAVGDAGNVLMVSGAAVLAGSRQAAAANALIEFLLSDEAQEYFAGSTFEYPVRSTIATHPDVPPLADLRLADVDQAALTDLAPTLAMLQELGLQ